MALTLAQARKYVSKPNNISYEIYENGDTKDIIDVCLFADKQEASKRYMKQLAQLLRGRNDKETCQNVWQFARKNLRYLADPNGHEKVKSSRWSIHFGSTLGLDCKSYSVMIIAILRELGIKCRYRFVSWEKDSEITHVYPIALVDKWFEFPIAVDAIPDSCGFNCEIRYAYNRDYDMTKISYIDGVKGSYTDSYEIPKQNNINFGLMTDGEAALALAKDRLNLLLNVHSDSAQAKNWLKGIEWIDNALFRGLHNGNIGLPWGLFKSDEEQNIIAFIKKAQTQQTPAQGKSIAMIGRQHIGQGIRELGHVGEVVLEDCLNLCTNVITVTDESGTSYETTNLDQNCYDACERKNKIAKAVLDFANKGAYNVLYNYMTNEQIDAMQSIYRGKYEKHIEVILKIATYSGISLANINTLFKTEIMRKNAESPALGAMSPEQAINMLIAERNPEICFNDIYQANPEGKIGDPISATLLIIYIIGACLATATVGMVAGGIIQIIKDKEPSAFDKLNGLLKVVVTTAAPTLTGGYKGLVNYQGDTADFRDTRNQPCSTGFTKATNGQCIPIITVKKTASTGWILPLAIGGTILYGFSRGKKK